MKTARDEKLNIWQNQDSSASKHVKEAYPDAKVMICGGHAGKSHLKQLQNRAKQKKFSAPTKKEIELFPEIETVECHCKKEVQEKTKDTGKKKRNVSMTKRTKTLEKKKQRNSSLSLASQDAAA